MTNPAPTKWPRRVPASGYVVIHEPSGQVVATVDAANGPRGAAEAFVNFHKELDNPDNKLYLRVGGQD